MISRKQKIGYGILALLVGLGYPLLNRLVSLLVFYIMSAVMKNQIHTLALLPYYIELFCDLITGLIYALILILAFRNTGIKEKIKQSMDKTTFLHCIVIGFGALGLSTLWILCASKIPQLSESMHMLEKFNSASSYGGFLSLIVLPVILAPIIEEIAFRGIVFGSLEKIRPGIFPIIGSALLFAIMHTMFLQSVYTFMMGLIAGLVYMKTHNLMYPIAIHMTNNLLSSLQMMMPSISNIMNIIVMVMIIPMGYLLYRIWKQAPDPVHV